MDSAFGRDKTGGVVMQNSFHELQWKEVIGISDGTRYGYISDLNVDMDTGQILSFIVPSRPRFFGLFGKREERVIHWDSVKRFGEDILLIEGVPEVRSNPRKKAKRLFE